MPQGTPDRGHGATPSQRSRPRRWKLQRELDAEYPVDGGSIVMHVLASVGASSRRWGGRPTQAVAPRATHLGEVSIELLGGGRATDQRSKEVAAALARAHAADSRDVEELVFASDLFSAGDPIDVEARRPDDVEDARRGGRRLKAKLAEYAGTLDIADSFREGKKRSSSRSCPLPSRSASPSTTSARQVRQAFYGAEAQRIQRGRDDVRVMVRYPAAASRRFLADLENLRIRTPDGSEVPSTPWPSAEQWATASSIKRRRPPARHQRDRRRQRRPEGNAERRDHSRPRGELPARRSSPNTRGSPTTFEGEQREQRKTLAALIAQLRVRTHR